MHTRKQVRPRRHSLPVQDVAAVQVVQRHEQLHKPAHHGVLGEVALLRDLLCLALWGAGLRVLG